MVERCLHKAPSCQFRALHQVRLRANEYDRGKDTCWPFVRLCFVQLPVLRIVEVVGVWFLPSA